MDFSENLKKLLSKKMLKQAELCRLTGIQTSLMSDYMNSKKSPTIKNAILIADALNITLDELVGKAPLNTECSTQTKTFCEICKVLNELSEDEQRYMLENIKAVKKLTKE